MPRRGNHPLWRSAPLRLWRTPGWLALVGLGATLLVAAFVAPLLFSATARSSALDAGLDAVRDGSFPVATADLRVTWQGVLPSEVQPEVLDRLDALPAYGAPVVGAVGTPAQRGTKPVVRLGDRTVGATLWYHDGAVEALGGDPDRPGVWLSEKVAARLGAGPGDRIRLGLLNTFVPRADRLVTTVVAGTYPTARGSQLPRALAGRPGADRLVLPIDPDQPGVGTPLAIAGGPSFGALARRLISQSFFTVDLPLERPTTPDRVAATVRAVQQLARDAFDDSTSLASEMSLAEPLPARLTPASGLPDLYFESEATAKAARVQVQPYAVAGQVLAAALVLASWVLLGRSRGREQGLASGLGLRPWELAGLAVLEVLPVAVLAVPAGIGLALLGVRLAGPPNDLGLDALGKAEVVRGVAAAGAVVVLCALGAIGSAWRADRRDRESRLERGSQAVPWGLVALAATGAVTVGVLTTDVADRSRTPLTTVFPLLVAVSAAVVVGRLAELVPLGRAGGRPGGPRWLAGRRSRRVLHEATALTVVLAVTLGLFGYALTVRRGVTEGVEDKVDALAGTTTALELERQVAGQGTKRALLPPVPDSTLVWRQSATLPPGFGAQPLMAIDPTTFGDVADWGSSGELAAGRRLLPELRRDGPSVPVILAGDTDQHVGDRGQLGFNEEYVVPYVVVGVVPAFPGSEAETGTVSVIVSARRLFPEVPQPRDPRRKASLEDAAGAFSAWVWSRQRPGDLRAALAAEHLTGGRAVLRDEVKVTSQLLAGSWAAGYLLALGVVVLALTLAAGLVLALRLADRDAVADVLLGRMGFARREVARSRTWEVAYAVLVAAVATAVTVVVLRLAPTTVDQAAAIPPLARPRLGLLEAGVLAALALVVVLAAWAVGSVRARRRVPEEVLRGNG